MYLQFNMMASCYRSLGEMNVFINVINMTIAKHKLMLLEGAVDAPLRVADPGTAHHDARATLELVSACLEHTEQVLRRHVSLKESNSE